MRLWLLASKTHQDKIPWSVVVGVFLSTNFSAGALHHAVYILLYAVPPFIPVIFSRRLLLNLFKASVQTYSIVISLDMILLYRIDFHQSRYVYVSFKGMYGIITNLIFQEEARCWNQLFKKKSLSNWITHVYGLYVQLLYTNSMAWDWWCYVTWLNVIHLKHACKRVKLGGIVARISIVTVFIYTTNLRAL